ncbi:MaoC family dehydratase [Halalkalibacter urbisdiaboli]|uniref:MaoC family dehydratase n=1 Tax=Halalkalibacter urbisdiaboli TaxID=1960589 RepID=UPI000B44F3D7|nr:MaoC family dehydratase [Halalkalibacter urbisdiaboli]
MKTSSKVTLQPITINITDEMIKEYGALHQDINPIHFDNEAAKKAGFPSKIAHGMLTMALAQKVLTLTDRQEWFLSSYQARFTAPVFSGEMIRFEPYIVNEDKDSIEIIIEGINRDSNKVLDGIITIMKRKTT